MRKLALLLAAALVMSAPLIAATPTLTYAAAKKAAKKVAKKEAAKEVDLAQVNNRFARALDDLFRSLATHRHGGGDTGGKKAAKKAR